MFTPIFIQDAGWGCYLFFACINFLYLPVIFFFYPETAGRTLEEIDIIFAKSYTDKTAAWRVAANLPKLSLAEIEDHGNALGLYDDDLEKEDELEEDVDSKEQSHPGFSLFQRKKSSKNVTENNAEKSDATANDNTQTPSSNESNEQN